ncbi:MAG: hypothetical protein QXJ14_02060 [Candidatus Aenigmatarchaeota archaeon]
MAEEIVKEDFKVGEFNYSELENAHQFVNKKFIVLLFIDNGNNIIDIFKKMNGIVSYHYLQISISELQDFNILNLEQRGREVIINLTEKGEKLKQILKDLIMLINKK